MERIDQKKALKQFYNPSPKAPIIVDVPELPFLMIDGTGDPNKAPAFAAAVEALYAVSYTLKFLLKKEPIGIDAVVMPLEALWSSPNMSAFQAGDRDNWQWTAMIVQPAPVTSALIEEAVAQVQLKKNLGALQKLRFERYHEGLATQIMYYGPYAAEGPTIAELHAFIAEHGYILRGRHHEIYLSDAHRMAPERIKTILRQPIAASQ